LPVTAVILAVEGAERLVPRHRVTWSCLAEVRRNRYDKIDMIK